LRVALQQSTFAILLAGLGLQLTKELAAATSGTQLPVFGGSLSVQPPLSYKAAILYGYISFFGL
jgi:hypothetical protein